MPDRKTALFVGINQRYINPTNSLLPAVLQRFCNVRFYGPGFVSQATLDRGVERYVDSLGGIDLIVSTSQCCSDMETARLNRFLHRYTALLNGGEASTEFLADVTAFFRKNQKRVLCVLTDVDPHAVQQSTLDSLLRNAGYFICWGHGFLDTLRDREMVASEKYLQRMLNKSLVLGLFDGFVDRYRTQIINLGHVIADTEFYWGALDTRKYDVAVPGSRYSRRRDTLDALGKLDGVRVAGLGYRYAYQVAERLALRPYANYYLVHLYNLAFQRAMSQSKVCVTDGGANNYPVRKFLEIPAAGALMVCWPAVGLEALGFRDGQNCIFVREAGDVARTIGAVVRDVSKFEPMATAGQDLVFRHHSVSARAAQLQEAIHRIEAGSFNGSLWHEGRFQCVADDRGARMPSPKQCARIGDR
jgi:hypothetical protein